MSEFGSIVPVSYQLKFLFPCAQECIFVNWLDVNYVSRDVLERHPIIHSLKGWRNRELYEWLKSHDWTERMYR
jgi:hypothetical protein